MHISIADGVVLPPLKGALISWMYLKRLVKKESLGALTICGWCRCSVTCEDVGAVVAATDGRWSGSHVDGAGQSGAFAISAAHRPSSTTGGPTMSDRSAAARPSAAAAGYYIRLRELPLRPIDTHSPAALSSWSSFFFLLTTDIMPAR